MYDACYNPDVRQRSRHTSLRTRIDENVFSEAAERFETLGGGASSYSKSSTYL